MILDGKKLSLKINEDIKKEIDKLKRKPKVVDILIGDDSNSLIYVKNKEKACINVGIDFNLIKFDINTKESEIIDYIKKLNNDDNIDAIMIQLPLPKNFNKDNIINSISPKKDVDALTNFNRLNNDYLLPCTPKGILRLLSEYNILLKDKNIVVIGRGQLVGSPISKLLGNNVTVCHSKTKDLKKYTKNADILICAANKENIVTKDMVAENCVIIDCGNFYKDGKFYGNVEKDVVNKVKYITPVPGGIGPMTVSMFLENILICYKNKN